MSIGRLGPSNNHFVVAWDVTMMGKEMFLGSSQDIESSIASHVPGNCDFFFFIWFRPDTGEYIPLDPPFAGGPICQYTRCPHTPLPGVDPTLIPVDVIDPLTP